MQLRGFPLKKKCSVLTVCCCCVLSQHLGIGKNWEDSQNNQRVSCSETRAGEDGEAQAIRWYAWNLNLNQINTMWLQTNPAGHKGPYPWQEKILVAIRSPKIDLKGPRRLLPYNKTLITALSSRGLWGFNPNRWLIFIPGYKIPPYTNQSVLQKTVSPFLRDRWDPSARIVIIV